MIIFVETVGFMKHFYLLSTFILLALLTGSCSVQNGRDFRSVAILGDSYSTFDGFVPEGNAIWYSSVPNGRNDVTSVEQTWWKQFCDAGEYELVLNDSYSGSTICNTGYGRADYSDRSFITRVGRSVKDNPDLLLIFGATNDSWADAPVGELQFSDWTEADLYKCLPAYCYMLDWLKSNAPQTSPVCILNSELKYEVTAGIMEACRHYDVPYILLKDIEKLDGHPSIAGMTQISMQLTDFINSLK